MEISNTILPGKSQLPPSRAAETLTRPALRRRKREHIPEAGKTGIKTRSLRSGRVMVPPGKPSVGLLCCGDFVLC